MTDKYKILFDSMECYRDGKLLWRAKIKQEYHVIHDRPFIGKERTDIHISGDMFLKTQMEYDGFSNN
jgi:hypothetical protein